MFFVKVLDEDKRYTILLAIVIYNKRKKLAAHTLIHKPLHTKKQKKLGPTWKSWLQVTISISFSHVCNKNTHNKKFQTR